MTASEARKGQQRLRSPSSSATHLGPVHLSTLEWILMHYTSSPGRPQNQIQPQMPWALVAGSKRNRCRLVWYFVQSLNIIHFVPSGTNHFLCPCHLPWKPTIFPTVPFQLHSLSSPAQGFCFVSPLLFPCYMDTLQLVEPLVYPALTGMAGEKEFGSILIPPERPCFPPPPLRWLERLCQELTVGDGWVGTGER